MPEIDATVNELYLSAINETVTLYSAKKILKDFQSGYYTDKWLVEEFKKLAIYCIKQYSFFYTDKKWLQETLNNNLIVQGLSEQLKYYYTEVYRG